jgi:hypothetical protein
VLAVKGTGEIGTGEFFDLDANDLASPIAFENVFSNSTL